MPNVFLSYSSQDKQLAERIALDLSNRGIRVWFDEWSILVGESVSQKIEQGLDDSDFVLVLLSKISVKHGWVGIEWRSRIAEEIDNDKTIILPLKSDDCKIPTLLIDKKYADFSKDYKVGLKELLEAINQLPGIDANVSSANDTDQVVKRPDYFRLEGMEAPCFFPAISSAAKNSLSPLEHLTIISKTNHPSLLISAYDIRHAKSDRQKIHKELTSATENGRTVMVDSGLYEKKWLRADKWPKDGYREALRNTPFHIAFHYDAPIKSLPSNPSLDDVKSMALTIKKSVELDRKHGEFTRVSPIIHSNDHTLFPSLCYYVAKELDYPPVIAIPEREMGRGILQISKTIKSIRNKLNTLDNYVPIHILGTGNPISILVYSSMGADSFDGLDWCQTVVDHDTAKLHHSLQLDFFQHQTPFGRDLNLPYHVRLFAHNLAFYRKWMEDLVVSANAHDFTDLLEKYVPKSFLPALSNID